MVLFRSDPGCFKTIIMRNNTETQKETKRTIRAKKLLLFFAEWADDTKSFGIEGLEQSLDYLEEAFINSDIADNKKARAETFYWLHSVRRLVRQVSKK